MWHVHPQESLPSLLRHVTGRRMTIRSGPPIYAVHVDGQLLYASGKEDVEDFLCTATVIAGRQFLRLVTDAHPATILLTCGAQSTVIEIHTATPEER